MVVGVWGRRPPMVSRHEHLPPVMGVGKHQTLLVVRCRISELSLGYSVTLGRGYAGNSSHAGSGDHIADMYGVLRHHEEALRIEGSRGSQHGFNTARDFAESDDDENYDDGDNYDEGDAYATHIASNDANTVHDCNERQFIVPIGKRFANGKVHKMIRQLLNESIEGLWATYRQVSREVVNRMFDRFRTLYRWDQANDEVKKIFD